jgi:poly(3-hydroxybutyrate) depolymerase
MRPTLALLLALSAPPALPQDDVAGVPSVEQKIGGDAHQRYFEIGPLEHSKQPKNGYALLVVLPGGDGGEGFLAFVKRIAKNVLDKEWLVAEPVSVKWTDSQTIIWPTGETPVPKMEFTTEDFVEAVIADLAKRRKIDPERIFVLAWSSSGPAAYAISLRKKKSPTGFYVAMSVFHPKALPPLEGAKGQAYFIDHSPADATCPFKDAQDAEKTLKEKGAKVKLVTYEGGHGWQGNVFGRMKEGIAWLEKNHGKPTR